MKPVDVLSDFDPRLLDIDEGRRELTRLDPLLFALIYLPHHLKDSAGEITLSDFHLDLAEYGKTWAKGVTKPKQFRDAFIAPRECGKTTWLFLVLPLWAAAHQHIRFIAAYSDSAQQAQGHLLTLKQELNTNELLQADYPDLCDLEKSQSNRSLADNNWKTVRGNGFIFTASGVDVSNHGIKHGHLRPQLIILDDIEPGEANYSAYQANLRLATIWDDIAPQNIYARMVIVGTTTMPNSIIDQLRKYGELKGVSRYNIEDEASDTEVPQELNWIEEQNVRVHYYPAIIPNDNGTERSVWPEKWSIDWLTTERDRGSRDFLKNYLNRPVSSDGNFWTPKDVIIREGDSYGNTILSIDPAVTKKRVSDYTGLAVVSRGEAAGEPGVFVRYANQVRLSPSELAEKVTQLVDEYDVGLIYVEVNQGGDLWRDVFKDVPCKYRAVRQTVSKEIRAGKALNFYQRGMVFHITTFPALNEQLMAFPRVSHDDVLDATVSGVNYFLDAPQGSPVRAAQLSYIG